MATQSASQYCLNHPFIHTFTHRRRRQPCKVTVSSSGAVRVRCLAQRHPDTRRRRSPGIEPATWATASAADYLGAVIGLGLQVFDGNQPTQQAALLVTRWDVAQVEDDLRLPDEELQVNGESGHVDGELPIRCERCHPAAHLALGVDLGTLKCAASGEAHRPHGHHGGGAHLGSMGDVKREQGWGTVMCSGSPLHGRRYRSLQGCTSRLFNSFYPSAIKDLNSWYIRTYLFIYLLLYPHCSGPCFPKSIISLRGSWSSSYDHRSVFNINERCENPHS